MAGGGRYWYAPPPTLTAEAESDDGNGDEEEEEEVPLLFPAKEISPQVGCRCIIPIPPPPLPPPPPPLPLPFVAEMTAARRFFSALDAAFHARADETIAAIQSRGTPIATAIAPGEAVEREDFLSLRRALRGAEEAVEEVESLERERVTACFLSFLRFF